MKRKGLFGLLLTLILSASFLSILSLPKNTLSVGASVNNIRVNTVLTTSRFAE